MKNIMSFEPYPPTMGRKFRNNPKLRKLNRPLGIIFKTRICECRHFFTNKYKIRLLKQLLRLFLKDSLGFRVDGYFQNGDKCQLKEGDYIRLVCHSTKSILRKLLLRLQMTMDDYKLLKRRKYCLIFTFFICDKLINNNKINITLDINCHENDMYHFFITMHNSYSPELMQLIFYYLLEETKTSYNI